MSFIYSRILNTKLSIMPNLKLLIYDGKADQNKLKKEKEISKLHEAI